MAVNYLRFRATMRAEGISRDTLVFQYAGQPLMAWFRIILFDFILVFDGFWVFPSVLKPFPPATPSLHMPMLQSFEGFMPFRGCESRRASSDPRKRIYLRARQLWTPCSGHRESLQIGHNGLVFRCLKSHTRYLKVVSLISAVHVLALTVLPEREIQSTSDGFDIAWAESQLYIPIKGAQLFWTRFLVFACGDPSVHLTIHHAPSRLQGCL